MTTIIELKKQIIPAFTQAQLELLGVPTEEQSILLNYKIFPIDIFIEADWNYKKENEALDKKLNEALKRFGQTQNIYARELETGYYEIPDGNHRFKQAKDLGKKFLFAYDLGKITKSDAIRRAISTNEIKYTADNIKLAELIKEISVDFDITDLSMILPYSEIELNDYVQLMDFDWSNFNQAEPEVDNFVAETNSETEVPKEITIKISGSLFEKLQTVKEIANEDKALKCLEVCFDYYISNNQITE